ncbi:TPA: hypothetical protein DCG86_03270 [Candidatus Marinimicrobia bacterium]|nr:hypothetical protein [Candidatus Neomarinimicrobiota bacterium]HBY18001.1 hypothetical protein [Candidatus Neomarinimicrobiota bacterium]
MPASRQLITEEDLNRKTLTLYTQISAQNKKISTLQQRVDSLQTLLDSTGRFLYEKDIEIDQLRAEIRVLNQENDAQLRYLQDMIIEQSIALDSLFAEFVEQQDFELFLTDLRDVPDDQQSALFLQKQLGTLKTGFDSLAQQIRTVVQHQNFLRQDLSIVESSIMDIIKFSSDKYLREIEKRHNRVMTEQESLAQRQDSLITAYHTLMEGLTDFVVILQEDRDHFRDSVEVALKNYEQYLHSLQLDVIACLEDQARLQTQLQFFRDNQFLPESLLQEPDRTDSLLIPHISQDTLQNHEN